MVGIYKITSPSGKIYIGQSVDIEKRERDYLTGNNCKKQVRLYHSLIKYSFSEHIFEVVEECGVDQLNVRERYWQDYYSVLNGEGLNCKLTSTEDRSGRMSEDTRKRMSEAKKGKERSEKQYQALLVLQGLNKERGTRCPCSEERKKKISEAKKGGMGIPRSEETRRKMSEAKKGKVLGPRGPYKKRLK